MSNALTVGERIVLHLAQYSRLQEDFDVPLDVSQDGIALALRISRAHAAIELKKLKESEEVWERLAHIKRGKTKRKVYFLTPKGEIKSNRIREFAQSEGIEIMPLLDLKKCKPSDLWDSLDPYKRDLLAMACTFRKPFNRAALPPTTVSLLPVNNDGVVEIPSELRNSILNMIPKGDLRKFHSFAADYWLDIGDIVERLYHLINAGRTREAEMLIASRGQQLISGANDDLHSILSKLENPSERYRDRVRFVRAMVARNAGHKDIALNISLQMQRSETTKERSDGLFVDGMISMDAGDYQGAYVRLMKARDLMIDRIDARIECEIAEALMNLGRNVEAKGILERVLMNRSGRSESDGIDRVYYQLGMISYRSGNGSEAIKCLSKSLGLTKMTNKSQLYRAISDAYTLVGMRDKAQEFSSKIPSTRKWGSS